MPHTHIDAVVTGLTFLSWLELEKEEQPPRRIWFDGDRIKEHFKAVEKRREEKYGSGDGKPPRGEIEDPVSNGFSLIAKE